MLLLGLTPQNWNPFSQILLTPRQCRKGLGVSFSARHLLRTPTAEHLLTDSQNHLPDTF